ncbi:sensor histidine kinase [Leucobacter coleopterorum]|uniref:histidine kinase n=1 Tax=Leucobacter coleopterorum TaxID=2714933 RepID=A0ABX6JVT0_9MICO|nr:histidine kinase [Leucobacter coleopterorum]QIM17678.1 sensor histidine kinase [Leucobacter coleopterorum]
MTSTASAIWVRPKPNRAGIRADAALALGLALSGALTTLLYQRMEFYKHPADLWVIVLGIGLCTLPLTLRRRYPVPVAIVAAIGFFVCGQFEVPEVLVTNVSLFIALYTVGAWEQDRRLAFWSRFGITAAMLLWVVIALVISSSDPDAYPGVPRTGLFSAFATFAVLQVLTNLIYFVGAFLFGERSWRAARTVAHLEAQGRELDLERQTSAAQAVALDRITIARELHDVVAHHVSVMGIQAAAARRSLERDPKQASRALEVVEESAHTAVEELRRLLHTLRTPEAESGSTTIGIAQLGALVAESQSSGLPTTLIVAGDTRPLPLLVDVALYRVVQEALTNVRKHAGRGAVAEVRLRFSQDSVEVEVSDDGVRQTLGGASVTGAAGSSKSIGSNLGLRGMQERIGAVGGTVSAGRRERGGFIVRASVPLKGTQEGGA